MGWWSHQELVLGRERRGRTRRFDDIEFHWDGRRRETELIESLLFFSSFLCNHLATLPFPILPSAPLPTFVSLHWALLCKNIEEVGSWRLGRGREWEKEKKLNGAALYSLHHFFLFGFTSEETRHVGGGRFEEEGGHWKPPLLPWRPRFSRRSSDRSAGPRNETAAPRRREKGEKEGGLGRRGVVMTTTVFFLHDDEREYIVGHPSPIYDTLDSIRFYCNQLKLKSHFRPLPFSLFRLCSLFRGIFLSSLSFVFLTRLTCVSLWLPPSANSPPDLSPGGVEQIHAIFEGRKHSVEMRLSGAIIV